jgi:hypothetical protein
MVYILHMACSNCKKKKPEIQKLLNNSNLFDKTMSWVIAIWSLLGLYGLYSLIKSIIKLL